jgi:DUF917 family protein
MPLDVDQLHDYAQGCAILGSGGGGDVDAAVMQATAALTANGAVDVVDLDDLPDDALVMPVAGWGAPTVGIEKLGSGREGATLTEAVARWFERPVAAVMAGEIGGGNGVLPLAIAAELGLPLIDADGMGRAFPEGPQVAMHVAGLSPAPVFLTDEHDNVVTLHPIDGDWYERLARTVTVAFGGTALGADFVMAAATARNTTVRGTVSLALDLGRAVRTGGVDAVTAAGRGHTLLRGKVTDVQRRTTAGFARGTVTVEGTGDDRGRVLEIHVQNENLLATEDGRPTAMTPDLITLVDEATGQAIPTERVRFGHRVAVLAFPSADVWRTEGGLAVAGPGAFGFETPYVPIEKAAHG